MTALYTGDGANIILIQITIGSTTKMWLKVTKPFLFPTIKLFVGVCKYCGFDECCNSSLSILGAQHVC